jgi:hypothetical protein
MVLETADEENLKEVNEQDTYMKDVYQKELGKDFKSFSDGVCTGEVSTYEES